MNKTKLWLIRIGVAVFVLAALKLGGYYSSKLYSKRSLERLAAMREEQNATPVPTALPSGNVQIVIVTTQTAEPTPTVGNVQASDPTKEPEDSPSPTPTLAPILDQYVEFCNLNSDFYGWIKIDGTVIDYPVMWRENDSEYFYLHNDFYGKRSSSGVPFIDYRCGVNPRSTNLIIYGHAMRDGSMFRSISYYEHQAYYEEHKYIVFDTRYETATYEVVGVFRSQVYDADEDVFKFYNFINAETEEEFNEYMDNVRALNSVEIESTAVWGDQLITLVTCAYHVENGRFVVVAKKITD